MLELFAKGSREIKGKIVDRLDVAGSGGNRDVIPELSADNRPQPLPGNDPDQHRFITLFHDLEVLTLFVVFHIGGFRFFIVMLPNYV